MVNRTEYRPPEGERTFESRLKFIHDIFANRFPQEQIMARCVQYKLDASFDAYIKDIHKSLCWLYGKDPMEVLKKIDG